MVISGLISLSICATAAYRLWYTPLADAALALTGLSVVAALLLVGLAVRKRSVPRSLTALSHVCGALGAFFVFVSFSLP